jgi:hypothetical protein
MDVHLMESRDTSVVHASGLAGKIQHLVVIQMNVKKRYCEPMKSAAV